MAVPVGQMWECWRRGLGGRRTQSPGEMGGRLLNTSNLNAKEGLKLRSKEAT